MEGRKNNMAQQSDINERLEGIQEKLGYLEDSVNEVGQSDVKIRRKGALNIGPWIYSIEQLAQHFKSLNRSDFDSSLKPILDKFNSDPIINWWLNLRCEIVHNIPPRFAISVAINFLGPDQIRELDAQAPSGTVGTFIGDELGGSGWKVAGNDGSTREVYFNLPNSIGSAEVNFPNPPYGERIEKLASEALALCNGLVTAVKEWVDSQES